MEQKSESRLRYQSKRSKYGGGSFRLQSYIGLVLDAKRKIKFRIAKSRFRLVKGTQTKTVTYFNRLHLPTKKQTNKREELKRTKMCLFNFKNNRHKHGSYDFHNVEEGEPHYSSPLDKSNSCVSQ